MNIKIKYFYTLDDLLYKNQHPLLKIFKFFAAI